MKQDNIDNFSFCTLFNYAYLSRGLALVSSIKQYRPDDHIYILCMDEKIYNYLSNLSDLNLTLIRLCDFEKEVIGLLNVKKYRTSAEYYFTCTGALPGFILRSTKDLYLIFVDADSFFFSNPSGFLNKLKRYSIGITEHNFSNFSYFRKKYGNYNVGLIYFKSDSEGIKCAENWSISCITWCYDIVDGKRYADQKYLDNWAVDYENVLIIRNRVNIGPWSIGKYKIELDNGNYYFNNEILIHYHFAGLRIGCEGVWHCGLSVYFTKISNEIRDLYQLYINELNKLNEMVEQIPNCAKNNGKSKLNQTTLQNEKLIESVNYEFEVVKRDSSEKLFIVRIINKIIKKILKFYYSDVIQLK